MFRDSDYTKRLPTWSGLATVAVVGGALCLGGIGCSSLGGGSDSKSDRGSSSRRDDRGSTSDVPTDVSVLDEGRPAALRANIPADGRVWVRDITQNRTIWSGRVDRGDEVSLQTSPDRILINGKRVSDEDLGSKNTFRILYQRSSGSRSDRY